MVKKVHLTEEQIKERISQLETMIKECSTDALKSKRKRIFSQLAKLKKAQGNPDTRVNPEEEKEKTEKKKLKRLKKRAQLTKKIKKKQREEAKTKPKDNKQHVLCLACKKWGHTADECPEKSSEKLCYNCGSHDHTIYDCPQPRSEGFKFAKCFHCGETGHIASQCKNNENGIYYKGGQCFNCGSKEHLAKNCPMKSDK